MNVLAIDTSTDLLMLAAGGNEAAIMTLRNGLKHSPALLPMIGMLLDRVSLTPGKLDLIVCTIGPGSFTGIRIGLATAKGMSLGLSIPVVGISTLDAFAHPYAFFPGAVFPVIDARKGKYYTALHERGVRKGDYLDISPEAFGDMLAKSGPALLVGPDSEKILESLAAAHPYPEARACGLVDPRVLLRMGEEKFDREGASPESLVPLYLRKSEAEITMGRTV